MTLLVIEAIAVVVLLMSGVALGDLVTSAGPVIALTLALLNPTVQELGRRRPRLTIQAAEADRRGVVVAPAARPWPSDTERIVNNELADARQTLDARPTILDAFAALTDQSAGRPSAAEKERAVKAFHEALLTYEAELRGWLADYRQASRERASTFQLTLRLVSAASGAHADAITIVLDLPEGATIVDELPEVGSPPERPAYRPPRPRRVSKMDLLRGTLPVILPRPLRAAPFFPVPRTWTEVDDGRQLEATIGDLQAGRALTLGEPLLIRVMGPGRHEVGWTVFSKSLRRAASGTLILDLPDEPPGRPAFGRLHGILAFPDVPIGREESDDTAGGEESGNRAVSSEVRSGDPPLRLPSSSEPASSNGSDTCEADQSSDRDGDALAYRLNEAAALWQWRALGLDPADDGPDHLEVRRAERAGGDS